MPDPAATIAARAPWRRAVLRGAATLLLLGAASLLAPRAALAALDAAPAASQGLLAWHFGRTLRRGREPLIARYTRHDFGRLPPECAGYARALTGLWALVLAATALAHLAALAGWLPAGAVLMAGLAAMPLLFLGEHAVRNRRFPQLGRATPARTLRAMRAAHAAGATGLARAA